ncbi:MAG: FAD-dependent thymidylate synthase [Clostridiales bacterium]|nr:FAD-dependent thymidylate synthase [Clostridiales bacterium]
MTEKAVPKVRLLTYTPEPEKTVAAAARLCYSEQSAGELLREFSDEQAERFLGKLVSIGHYSPFEHASFTFAVDGVSRALSHQLVRHRAGVSFSQKSQRYVKESQFEYIKPGSLAKNPALSEEFDGLMALLQEKYRDWLSAGVPAEDARYILPNAAATNLVVTMNARSLLHFFSLRCCVRAQWEIRALACAMRRLVKEVAPLLFAKAGPSCVSRGICFEGAMSCGAAPLLGAPEEGGSHE